MGSRKISVLQLLGTAVLLCVSACATAPAKSARKGLLERDPARITQTPVRKTLSEAFAPRTFSEVSLPGKWQWPLGSIEISSPYGERGSKFHQGVDLRANTGTPVKAASDGEVVYVGSKIKGYGRMVVLKHQQGFFTVYAHHSKNLVKTGQKVSEGEVIAYSGHSGHAIGAHLHFELRRGAQSIDPEYALNAHLKSAANRRIASKTKIKTEYEE